MEALNSSMVLDETTEEGRLFQTEIVLGKMSFSGHHYRQIVLYTVIHAMPEFALGWVPGSGICLYQETLYRSVSCRRRLRRTALCGTAGMATQARQANHRRYWSSSISCRSTWLQSSAPSPPKQSEFHYRDAK